MHAFGQFVGSWNLDVRWYGPDGELLHATTGECHFGWILGGLAVQDVWIVPSQRRQDPLAASLPWGDYGTSVRFFDPSIDAWRSTWVGPVRNFVIPFTARETPTGVELLGTLDADTRLRWSFSDITPRHSRGVTSRPMGRAGHGSSRRSSTPSDSQTITPPTSSGERPSRPLERPRRAPGDLGCERQRRAGADAADEPRLCLGGELRRAGATEPSSAGLPRGRRSRLPSSLDRVRA
jgi:hypothetical protein